MNAIAAGLDLAAYLRRIGFAGTPAPTRECLETLIRRHAAALPFENIEVLARRVPRLDLDGLQAKMVRQRRGGYCFEQNTLLRNVLAAIGFDAHAMEARIRSGVPADVVTARTHLATRVVLDGASHLVDVGCGILAPTAPLALASRDTQAAGSGLYRLVDVGDELLLQQREQAGWKDCYQLLPSVPHAIDCEMGNWFVATWPKSMLAANLLVGRAIEGGRLRLFNRRLSAFQPEHAAPVERDLHARAEFADVLADGFGLDVAPADLDAVMAALDRLPPA
ncbi:MAG: arylamine N-acetyltransferase family protein [Burkholderiaceae bacterium]